MAPPAKLVIIGIDAGDKDLILRWAAEGKLPNFKRAMDRGTWGSTEDLPGMEAGGVWPSFYTGVSPAKHGIYCGAQLLEGGTHRTRAVGAKDLGAEPFWDVLSQSGKRVAVIDAPYTFLSDKINGAQIVDWATHAPLARAGRAFRSSDQGLAEEIETYFGGHTTDICEHRQLETAEDYANYRDDLVDRVRRKTGLNLYLLEKGGWDCFFSVFHESHCAARRCWHFHDAKHPSHDQAMVAELGDIVEQVYAVIDEGIGRVLERMGPDGNVILFCSNGIGPNYGGSSMLDDVLLYLEGLNGEGIGRAVERAMRRLWLRSSPAIRKLVDQFVTTFWPLLKRSLLEANRSKRRCFAVHDQNANGWIRLNLAGREPKGRLSPGEEADIFCERLVEELQRLTRPRSSVPAIRRVVRTTDVFEGNRLNDLPDFIIEWNCDYPVHALCSTTLGRIENRDLLLGPTGAARPGGMFFALGPEIPAMQLNAATSVYSLAPAFARMLGVELPGTDAPPAKFLLAKRPEVKPQSLAHSIERERELALV